ncbi:MAG: right-handed parallel beta-helix repeat-containing protein [Acidobacteriota bacterium]|nr:right-handed parallel beta-helix repeat-containing protein [Blastocatellia bacterium]MDW8239084.1 right-handed parallel beta-helix repeat-containing protein [Acidobacteriota bacterium]
MKKQSTMMVSGVFLMLLCMWMLLDGSPSAAQAVLTVSKTPGAAAFTTIQAAIDAANPGDTILIMDSADYPEHLRLAKNNVTLQAAEGQSPTISGRPGAPDTLDTLDVSGTNGVTIRGIRFTSGSDDAITASPGPGATNLTVENCVFESLNDIGVILNNNSTGTVRNNIFRRLGTGTNRAGLGMSVLNGSNVVVEGNTFDDLLGAGIQVNVATATIRNNTFRGGPMNGQFSDGVQLVRSTATVVRNRFIDIGRIAIGTFTPQDDPTPRVTSSVTIINNLIFNSGTFNPNAGFGFQLVGTSNTRHNFTLINNTVADNAVCAILYALNTGGSSVLLVNNILSGSGGPFDILFTQQAASRGPRELTARNNLVDRDPIMIVGTNGNITGDPRYVAPLNGNYGVQAGSPVIDAGDDSVQGLPETDIAGNPRRAGRAVDIGAYEFQQP